MAINDRQLAEIAASAKLYALALMLCPCFSRRAAASPARRTRCPLTMCSSAAASTRASVELILHGFSLVGHRIALAKCSELFLLHAANRVDDVLAL